MMRLFDILAPNSITERYYIPPSKYGLFEQLVLEKTPEEFHEYCVNLGLDIAPESLFENSILKYGGKAVAQLIKSGWNITHSSSARKGIKKLRSKPKAMKAYKELHQVIHDTNGGINPSNTPNKFRLHYPQANNVDGAMVHFGTGNNVGRVIINPENKTIHWAHVGNHDHPAYGGNPK